MDSFTALRWQWEMGATDRVGTQPANWLRPAAAPVVQSVEVMSIPPAAAQPQPPVAVPAIDLSAVATLTDLKTAIQEFDGLEIKKSASQMVFGDGAPHPRVMFVGDAPGDEDDQTGRPFMGTAGKLLDKMLASIGLSRETNAYISHVMYWRPPANRQPTAEEIAMSLPFVRRHIALLQPEVIVVLGGTAAKALLNVQEGITRVRGEWREYGCESGKTIPALIMFHPTYLLRTPAQKALAWKDLLGLKARLTHSNP